MIDLKKSLRETCNTLRILSVNGGNLAVLDLIGYMCKFKQGKWSPCVTNITTDAGKVNFLEIKVITT